MTGDDEVEGEISTSVAATAVRVWRWATLWLVALVGWGVFGQLDDPGAGVFICLATMWVVPAAAVLLEYSLRSNPSIRLR
jgi:hypothetical protein